MIDRFRTFFALAICFAREFTKNPYSDKIITVHIEEVRKQWGSFSNWVFARFSNVTPNDRISTKFRQEFHAS